MSADRRVHRGKTEKEDRKAVLAAQCRVLTEAAVLWALLAAGAQLFFPEEQSALPEGRPSGGRRCASAL